MPHKLQLLKRHQRTKANQKLQISGCSGHASTSLPFCMHHDLHVFRSFFFFIIRAGTKSRRFNEDCQTSKTNYSLHFCAGALNGSDRPEWITTTKWERGRERGRKEVKEQERKGKSRRNSLPFLPWGVQCVGGVLYVSLASVSPVFHLRKSLKPNEVPAEEFLNPAKVCVFLCSTHLLLIKQWQAVKMLFDRNCGN